MNRPLTALFAALEALLVVGVGIGLTLAPLTLMWAFEYGLQVDWVVFWRAAVDVWLVGHGVDVSFTLDPTVAAATGLPGAADEFIVTAALLGFALLTLLLALRAGRRIGETSHRITGLFVAVGTVAVLSTGATLSASVAAATPVLWQGILFPASVFAIGATLGVVRSRPLVPSTPEASTAPGRATVWFFSALDDLRDRADAAIPRGLRRAVARLAVAGTLVVAGIVAVSAAAVAVLIATSYGPIIGLFEGVQSGYLGGAALTLAQLAALPNIVIWAASWFVGPGFALGTGSTVSPLGTVVGPVPAIPVLGAIPDSPGEFAFIGLLVPIVVSFIVASVLRERIVAVVSRTWWALAAAGAAIGALGGVALALLALISSGSAGPGRLADIGPGWLAVGGWGALEIGVPAALALILGGIDVRGIRSKPARDSAAR